MFLPPHLVGFWHVEMPCHKSGILQNSLQQSAQKLIILPTDESDHEAIRDFCESFQKGLANSRAIETWTGDVTWSLLRKIVE